MERLHPPNIILEIAMCYIKMALKSSKPAHKTLCDGSKISRIKVVCITVPFSEGLQISMQYVVGKERLSSISQYLCDWLD